MKIAMDGHSGSGKSTIAKKISEDLGYTYIDTGAMYRMITLYYLENNIDLTTELDVTTLENINLDMKNNKFYLNGEDVSLKIRQERISEGIRHVANYKNVREILVKKQRGMAKSSNVILDGRDIGSVVFPDAELKFFLTASVEKRAKRRVKQLEELGEKVDYNTVLENIKKRDHNDLTREIGPLVKVDDAIEIDSTNLTEEEVYKKVKDIIIKKENEIKSSHNR